MQLQTKTRLNVLRKTNSQSHTSSKLDILRKSIEYEKQREKHRQKYPKERERERALLNLLNRHVLHSFVATCKIHTLSAVVGV